MLLYSHISASVITKPCVVFLLYRKEIRSLYQRQLRGLVPSYLSDVISASLPVVKRWGQAHRCALGGCFCLRFPLPRPSPRQVLALLPPLLPLSETFLSGCSVEIPPTLSLFIPTTWHIFPASFPYHLPCYIFCVFIL